MARRCGRERDLSRHPGRAGRRAQRRTEVGFDGRYVGYWMQQSQRAEFNPALEYAVHRANELKLPLVVAFGLMDDYPEANLRHYHFLLQGLADVDAPGQTQDHLRGPPRRARRCRPRAGLRRRPARLRPWLPAPPAAWRERVAERGDRARRAGRRRRRRTGRAGVGQAGVGRPDHPAQDHRHLDRFLVALPTTKLRNTSSAADRRARTCPTSPADRPAEARHATCAPVPLFTGGTSAGKEPSGPFLASSSPTTPRTATSRRPTTCHI